VQNKYQLEEDDAYFSRRQSGKQTGQGTPNVDLNKIMQQYPSKVNEGTFDNRPTETEYKCCYAYVKNIRAEHRLII
jgi:hypothetical protein